MSARSLEDAIAAAGSPVELARNSQIGPYVYPAVPAEFSNWREEQVAWLETCALFDQSHHMTDLYIEGPDVLRLLSDTGINSMANAAVNKAKQFVAVNYDGYVIGDAILFFLDENRVALVGRPSAHNWVQFHAETGGYDVRCERDERTAVNPTGGRKLYRYQVQGPTALEVLAKATGGPLPEIKFFNMGWVTIAGCKVRALHHGMSGAPGLELFGPWPRDGVDAELRLCIDPATDPDTGVQLPATVRNAGAGVAFHDAARLVIRRCHVHHAEYGLTATREVVVTRPPAPACTTRCGATPIRTAPRTRSRSA